MPERYISSRHKSGFIYTALIFVFFCILLFLLPLIRQFVIIDYKSGEVLYSSDVVPGVKFSVTYIHSVNKSPVEDQFDLDSNYRIMLRKSIFKSFGAGVPSNLGDGDKFEYYKDRIEVSYSNSSIDRFILFVGVIADHHFRMNGQDFQLSRLSSPQRSVQFIVKKITVYQYLKFIITHKQY
ncbi:MAG: hypothetical protein CVV49_14135 [Spirochaetae bacterium HGW-Spirochaetae-5]|nr:MAG: hypothetical protein CVV49_14135 [Spirochaetae bacterium HGW-Spirochaetae-5]